MTYSTDRAYWRSLIAAASRGLTDAQLDAAVEHAVADAEAGRQPSAWHSVSAVTGNADICPCGPCSKAREAKGARAWTA